MVKILAFAGSNRRESLNRQLVTVASREVEAMGAIVTKIDLADFELPLYDGDLEEAVGLPANAVELQTLMRQHQGLLLACPEYNGSITPLLKNVIDWTSRPAADAPGLAAYSGKVAALLSASPGSLGGLRGLVHVRAILSGIGVHVIPGDVSVPHAHKAFADASQLADATLRERLSKTVANLVSTVDKLSV